VPEKDAGSSPGLKISSIFIWDKDFMDPAGC